MRFGFIIISIIIYTLVIFSSGYCQSNQDDEYNDVILMKSGGAYLEVKVIRTVPHKKIVVENRDGVEIEIPLRKIYAVTDKEHYPEVRAEFDATRPVREKNSILEPEHFALMGAASGGGHTSMSAAIVSGYYLKNFYAGAGLGWDDRPDGGYITFLIDTRFYSGVGRVKSYVYSEIGFFGGSRVGLGLGLKIPWGDQSSVLIQGGFRKQGNPDGDSYSAGVLLAGLTFRL
jgi:hypothetical protein